MLNAAIVGLGNWGRRLVDSVQGRSDKLRFVAGATRSPDKAADYARGHGIVLRGGYEELLSRPDIDAVVLATPHSQHAGQIAQAARAGKHVYVEKPFTLTRASAEEAVRAARERGIVLAAGFNRRFRPALVEMKRMAVEGALGKIVHIEGAMSGAPADGRRPRGGWRGSREESPGGAMTAKGIHILDQMLWFAGPVDSVYAFSDRRTETYAPLDDVTSLALHFRSGVTGMLSTIYSTAEFWRMHVFGTDGWAQVLGESTLVTRTLDGVPQTREYPAGFDSLRAALEGFADAVAGRASYPVSLDDAVNGSAVLEAIVPSAQSGQPVRIA